MCAAPANDDESGNLELENSQKQFKINWAVKIYDYFLVEIHEREKNK